MKNTNMQHISDHREPTISYIEPMDAHPIYRNDNIACKWESFRRQILMQWNRLSQKEVDMIGPDRVRLAELIRSKYGLEARLVENYLRNFERTLPLM